MAGRENYGTLHVNDQSIVRKSHYIFPLAGVWDSSRDATPGNRHSNGRGTIAHLKISLKREIKRTDAVDSLGGPVRKIRHTAGVASSCVMGGALNPDERETCNESEEEKHAARRCTFSAGPSLGSAASQLSLWFDTGRTCGGCISARFLMFTQCLRGA